MGTHIDSAINTANSAAAAAAAAATDSVGDTFPRVMSSIPVERSSGARRNSHAINYGQPREHRGTRTAWECGEADELGWNGEAEWALVTTEGMLRPEMDFGG